MLEKKHQSKGKNVNIFEYAEQCTKSRKRKTLDLQKKKKYFTRSHRLHDDIERLMIECFNKIPNVSGLETNPKILDTFKINSDDPFIPRPQNQIIDDIPPNELTESKNISLEMMTHH